MVQSVVDQEINKALLTMSLAYSPEQDKYAIQIALPLGIALQPGITIKVDEDFEVGGIPIVRCEPIGCLIEAEAATDLIDAFKSGTNGSIYFAAVSGQVTALPFSLEGFSGALKKLQQETKTKMGG